MTGSRRVVVLGASENPERYSYKAIAALKEKGYEPIPVHPTLDTIQGIPTVKSLGEIQGNVDTITVYVNPRRLPEMLDSLVSLKPRRIIANPGAESAELQEASSRHGIQLLEACTLVLLATGQF